LYLDQLDRAISASGFELIRYADDLAIPCANAEEASKALERLDNVTKAMDLSLNLEKTAIMSFDDGFAFLGEEISMHYPKPHHERDVPDRRALFVCREGVVRIDNGQVVVSSDEEEFLRVPQTLVGAIAVYGSTGVSAGLRSFALSEDIPITFLSRRGTYLGMLSRGRRPNARLIRQQIRSCDDDSFALALVRRIVRGKLANTRALLLRYGNRTNSSAVIEQAEAILRFREQAVDGESIEILRGLEGAAAAAYWRAFAHLVPSELQFEGRRQRPAPDPVNSALSFGYALLLGEVTGALITAGLDPSFGVLHTEQDTRPSLSLDVMEEFRSVIVDTTVLSLFRHKKLTEQSFRTDDGATLLTDKGRRVLIAAFADRMLTVFGHVPSGKRVSYRRSLLLQSWQMSNSFANGTATYEPISWR
jgi:CRISP-associated protein Cas1